MGQALVGHTWVIHGSYMVIMGHTWVIQRFEDGREMGVPVKRTRVLNSRSEDQFSSSSTDVNLTNKIDS